MKVSWKWLNEIIDLSSTNPNNLANYLNMAGFEVDNIYTINIINKSDTILNITTTTNRNYALNMIGIAQEVATIFNQKLHFNSQYTLISSNRVNNNKIIWGEFLHFYTYIGILFNNIVIKQSPQWMQSRLMLANIQPVNNIIDIKNYIALKWGYFFEIFDPSIYITPNNQKSINFIEVYENKHKINKTILTITKNNIPIILTNTTKNLTTEISNNTKIIFLESAILLKQDKNRQSLHNTLEKSIKYEKNLDRNILDSATKETIFLINKLCNGTIEDQIYCHSNKTLIMHIKVFDKNIDRILGSINNNNQSNNIPRITEILQALNFQPIRHNSYWLLTIPEYKQLHITREIDVIEEIARIYGFDIFVDSIPNIINKDMLSKRELIKRKIRCSLRGSGLYELIQSSLARPTINHIPIYNPLNEDCSSLRSNLITNLIHSTFYNTQQGNKFLNGFEIGTVFYKKQGSNYEDLHLAAIFGGDNYLRSLWSDKPKSLSWFQAKGILTNMLQNIGKEVKWEKLQSDLLFNHLFHFNRTANLYIGNQNIGVFGEVNPKLYYKMNIKNRIFGFEINLDILINNLSNSFLLNSEVKSYSKYPYVLRDISIIVPKTMNLDSLIHSIIENNQPFLKSVELFNEYIGNEIPDSNRSLNLRLKYQSLHTTFTNIQIAKFDQNIKKIIQQKFNIEIQL